MHNRQEKIKAKNLRILGKTYTEIQDQLKARIPKSTLSYWCRGLNLPPDYERKIKAYNKQNLAKAREAAIAAVRIRQKINHERIIQENSHLIAGLQNKNTAKIVLATLYMAGGSRCSKGIIVFSNADPLIIRLFLNLLRFCYILDESKFRCTLQCRTDQNAEELENFWSETTRVSSAQFYKARIDLRPMNQPSKNKNCKGVCRINYFSSKIYKELICIAQLMCGPIVQR